jgi:hypothetical protein
MSRLATCIDSKASLSRVEAARQEGKDLGVNKTPTTFVNGRIIVGLPSQATFVKTVQTHRANIMCKLNLHPLGQLTHYAIRNNIIAC